ncbi:lysophosphatidic acid receptor 1-B-like [Saccostrea cucullata]|uniref:lysophosphatidic acid receptor 1-B-like n=1 Tax=Saccostrea cuccullata TaxID=36930 RepID=UPI002ED3A4BD
MDNVTSQIDEEFRLEQWNNEMSVAFLPNTIFLVFSCIIGVVGNSCVLYVYGGRLRRKYEGRFFVPYLAAADLIVMLVAVGLNISINVNPVNYKNREVCTGGSFLVGFFSVWSICILILIAFQRYQKICKPMDTHMTRCQKKLALVFSLAISFLLNVIFIFTVGLRDVELQNLNITGKTCERLSEESPVLSIVHSVILSVFAVLSCSVLIVLYGLIGKAIYRHKRTQKYSLEIRGSRKTKVTRMSKTTLMFMIITIIFIISYIPTGIKMIVESMPDFSTVSLHWRFLTTFFVVNHFANPIVYAFMDMIFSRELKRIFCCVKDKFQGSSENSDRNEQDTTT